MKFVDLIREVIPPVEVTRPTVPVRERRRTMLDVVITGEDEPAFSAQGRTFRHGYRRMGAVSAAEQDADWSDVALRAETLWRRSALARRIIEMPLSLVLNREVRVRAADAPKPDAPHPPRWTVQEVLDRLWRVNELSTRIWDYELALRIRGILFLPAYVRRSDGRVRISMLAGSIREIIEDPHDLVVKRGILSDWGSGEQRRFYNVQRLDDPRHPLDNCVVGLRDLAVDGSGVDPWGNAWDGQGFLFMTNRLLDYEFGWSELLPIIDHLVDSEDFIADIFDRLYWLSAVVWEWVFEGADWSELLPGGRFNNFVSLNPPRSGSNILLNERVQLNAKTPDFAAESMYEYLRIAVIIATWAIGLPPAWFGIGEGANRAIALEQGAPARRNLENYQAAIRERWNLVCEFAISCAYEAGLFGTAKLSDIDTSFVLDLPSLDVRDLRTQIQVLSVAAETVAIAATLGLDFSPQTWVDVLAFAIREFGVEPTFAKDHSKVDEAADRIAKRLGTARGAEVRPVMQRWMQEFDDPAALRRLGEIVFGEEVEITDDDIRSALRRAAQIDDELKDLLNAVVRE